MRRLTDFPFPERPYLPGRGLHPNRDPASVAWRRHGEPSATFTAADWPRTPQYLFALDLFNHGYWWETHEVLEGLWFAAGRTTPTARFVQGLIQIAAGLLKAAHVPGGGRKLCAAGLAKLRLTGGRMLGVDAADLESQVASWLDGPRDRRPRIDPDPEII